MREPFHGGGVRTVSRRLGVSPEEFLDFSSNLNPLGPPDEVLNLLARGDEWQREATVHPPEYPWELSGALAEAWGVEEESLAVVPGSVHGIYLLFQLLRPRATALHVPTFSEYARAAAVVNSRLVVHPTSAQRGFRLCLGEYSWRVEPGIEMAVLCNPNNPTGYLMPMDEVDALARWCDREGCYLVVDEAFVEFTSQESAVSLVGEHSHLVVLRSFTKAYAIPGLRVGAVVAPPTLAERVRKAIPPWSVGEVAQQACILALRDRDHLERTRTLVKGERERLKKGLQGLGLNPAPSWANYLLCRLPEEKSGETLYSHMLEERILIRRCHNMEGLDHRFVRVSVRLPHENRRLLEAMETALQRG